MEEEFYSTLKLTSGEEIIAKVSYLPEENSLILESPMLVETVSQKKIGKSVQGFVLKEWINSSYDSMFIIKMDQVITMSELDERIQAFYLNNVDPDEYPDERSINVNPKQFTRKMGYIGSVNETKVFLEEIYKKS